MGHNKFSPDHGCPSFSHQSDESFITHTPRHSFLGCYLFGSREELACMGLRWLRELLQIPRGQASGWCERWQVLLGTRRSAEQRGQAHWAYVTSICPHLLGACMNALSSTAKAQL